VLVSVAGTDVTEEGADKIYQRELKKVSRKFTHMRYHSFLMYFGVLKKLKWVETTGITEDSGIQDNYSNAPSRVYYRLTAAGKAAGDELWSNPLFTLYPENGANHKKVRPTKIRSYLKTIISSLVVLSVLVLSLWIQSPLKIWWASN